MLFICPNVCFQGMFKVSLTETRDKILPHPTVSFPFSPRLKMINVYAVLVGLEVA